MSPPSPGDVGSSGDNTRSGWCITCSRSLLDARIVAGVWLYEAKEIPTCNAVYLAGYGDYEYCGARATRAHADLNAFTCESCAKHVVAPDQHTAANLEAILNRDAVWRYYPIADFHACTCENTSVYQIADPDA